MTTLSHYVGEEEAQAPLQRIAVPKKQWICKHDHTNRRPEVTKLVDGVVVRYFNVNVFVVHNLVVVDPSVVPRELCHKRKVEFGFGSRFHWFKVPIPLHLRRC